jgi:protein-disulfide isomerase
MERAIFTAQASLFPFGRPRDQAEYAAQLEAVKNKLTAMSAELNLDKKKMEQALSDHCRQAALEKRAEMADKLKINGTPTVYVNGVEAGPDQSEVRRAVEKALGREILPGPR